MRILIDAAAAGPGGGGATRVVELGRTLPLLRPDHEFLFVVRSELARAVQTQAANIYVVAAPLGCATRRHAWQQLMVPRLARRFSPDVLFGPFNILPLAIPSGCHQAVMVSNLAPYSDLVRHMYYGRTRLRLEQLRVMTTAAIERTDVVLLQAEHARSVLPLDAARSVVVIPQSPPDTARAQPSMNWTPGKPYLVLAVDLYRYKNVETVIRALSLVAVNCRPALVVCGRQLDRRYAGRLRRLARRCNVSDDVQFLGHIPHERVLGIIEKALAYVAPSRFENMTRGPREAMALATPVIASDIPAHRESCGSSAVYFDPDDAYALAQHVANLALSERVRTDLVERGRRHIDGLSWTTAGEAIVGTLEAVCE